MRAALEKTPEAAKGGHRAYRDPAAECRSRSTGQNRHRDTKGAAHHRAHIIDSDGGLDGT